MCSTDFEQRSRNLEDDIERKVLSFNAEVAAKRVIEVKTERELPLRFNDYEMWKAKLGRKVSEDIVKAMTASVEKLGNMVSLLQNETRLPQKINEVHMRGYGERNTVVGGCVVKLLKRFSMRFVGSTRCISKAIPK